MGLVSRLNTLRTLGAEFEGYLIVTGSGDARSAQESLAHAVTENGIRAVARGYSKEPLPHGVKVAVEYDSSIVPEQRYRGIRWAAIEVKIAPMLLGEWEATVPAMLDLLRYAGLRVNHSTGHHLTLGFPEIEANPRCVRSVWNLYHRFQNVLFGLVSPSRRANSYCRAMPSQSKLLHGANSLREVRRRLAAYDRYQFFNTVGLTNGSSPRIEIRSHHGTLDAGKARAWMHLHLAMFDHAIRRNCQAAPEPLPNTRKSLDALFVTCGLKPNTRVYAEIDPALRASAKALLKTWKKFNPTDSTNNKAASESDATLVGVGEEG